MFSMRHFGSDHDGRWAAGRGGRGRHGFGFGGRHGFGGGDMVRAGRMLATGDLRLIALALIAEQPRHGYEIMKVLEDKTSGWYSPSPGIVYPTLTFLEETGYVTAQADGAKKLYTITGEGRTHLEENRDFVDAVLARLAAIGEKVARRRERFNDEESGRGDDSMPRSIQGAIQDLSETVRALLKQNPEAKGRVIEALDKATKDLKGN
jgi:DNA-binding PadR family transcriptional regulator